MSNPVTLPPQTVNARDKIGIAAVVVTLLGGAWLMVAPWLVDYQKRSAGWTAGTIDEFVLGGALVVLAVAALTVFAAGALRELSRPGRHAAPREGRDDGSHEPRPAAAVNGNGNGAGSGAGYGTGNGAAHG